MSGNNPFLDHSQKLAIDLDVPKAHVLFEEQISDRLTH
jgi:hypothetical protein